VDNTPIGHLDQVAADCISGWASFPGYPDPVVVEIYIDDTKIWECLADQLRPEVTVSGHNSRCGFSIKPDLSSVGSGVRVFAKVRGTPCFLAGSGKFLQPVDGPYPPSLVSLGSPDQICLNAIGHLDKQIGDGRIAGWAGIPGQQCPVTVEIYLDRRKLTECVTGDERPDVLGAGANVGSHSGFSAEYDLRQVRYRSRLFANVRGCPVGLGDSAKFIKASKEQKLFFIHIAKTGGTTINEIAEFLYERSQTHLEVRDWQNNTAFGGFDFLSAHLSYQAIISAYKEHGFRFFTMLREPLNQFSSHLRYFVSYLLAVHTTSPDLVDPIGLEIAQALHVAGPDLAAQLPCLKSLSRDGRFQGVINNLFDNCMTRYFASVEEGSTVGPQDVRRAQEVLAELDAFGFLSLFPETLERLSRLTGKPWRDHSAVWMNKGVGAELVSRDHQNTELFKQFIWADLEVYETALDIFRAER
jgi:hypothetical protein